MKRQYILFLLLLTLGVLVYYLPKADAESGFFSPNCATSGCHAPSASTCDGCHAHGVHSTSAKSNINVAGTLNKTTYAPGETVSVTIDGGYRTGWVRAILYDHNMNELARSTGTATGGKGGGSAFPLILTAPAPAAGGSYTWKVAWYGNRYDKSGAFFQTACSATVTTNCWKADAANANHGQEIRSVAAFSVSAPSDTTAPTVTSFTIPSTSSSLTVPINTFTATDIVGVTGYLVNESSATPSAGAAGWSATAASSYTFTTEGVKTLYAWAKDAAGNVSAGISASVAITLPDTAAPTVTSFTIPSTSSSLTVPINTFTATDIVGVTGYLVNESSATPSAGAAGWSAAAATSYTFGAAGTKTLYAWAKDAAGNVSTSLSASVNITPPVLSLVPPATSGFYWDDVNKTLVIDSSNPIPAAGVATSGVNTSVYMAGSTQYNPQLIFEMAGGTVESPTAVQEGDVLGSLGINAFNGSTWDGNRKAIQIEASEPWSMTSGGYRIVFYTRDNGTVGEPFESMRIEDNGNVGIGTSAPSQKLEVSGGMMLNTTELKPTCDVTTRGTFWFTQDDVNGDSADICAKVNGLYGWKKLF